MKIINNSDNPVQLIPEVGDSFEYREKVKNAAKYLMDENWNMDEEKTTSVHLPSMTDKQNEPKQLESGEWRN